MTQSVLNTFKKVNISVKLWAFYLLKYSFSLKELITKNLEVKDKFNYESHKIVDSYENSFLSSPISLRLWSSFFVIL